MIYAILDSDGFVDNVIVADPSFIEDNSLDGICIDKNPGIGIGSKWDGTDWVAHKDDKVPPLSFDEINDMLEKLKNEYNG